MGFRGWCLYCNNNTNQAQLSLAELTGTNYTIIRNIFVLTTNSNFASLTYLHNLHTHCCMPLMHACTDQLTLCILMFQKVIQITMQNLKKIGSVWFGWVWFGVAWFFVFQVVKVVLVSIRTKFELSMCLVCPTIEINVCSAYLQNVVVHFFFLLFKHCESEKTALLCKGSLEKCIVL